LIRKTSARGGLIGLYLYGVGNRFTLHPQVET